VIAGDALAAPGTFDAAGCEASRAGRTTSTVGYLRHVAAVAGKDLRVELRSREILCTMVFFGAVVVLIFSFAFVKEGKPVGDVTAGILWIAVLFAGTLGLARAFDREREADTMRGLLLSPTPRSAIFLGKALGIAVFIAAAEAVVVPLIAFLFGAPLFRHPLPLALTLVLATVGIAVVGSVFAAMLLRSRARDVLLPVVLFPILVPLLIAATKSTGALVQPAAEPAVAYFWVEFLLAFDAVFVAVALWSFESLVIE
jgi:heme exporter protein CcmB